MCLPLSLLITCRSVCLSYATIWPLLDIIYFRTMASEDDDGGVDWINFNA